MVFACLLVFMVRDAFAQDQVGGHFGFAFPLVSRGDGQTTSISDDFVLVVPTGITVRRSSTFAFDLELAPVIQNDPRHINLTVHPGVAWGIGGGYSLGGRVAFDIGSATWSFTPLFNKGFVQVAKGATFFGELDVPIRFKEDAAGRGFTSIGLAVVLGLGLNQTRPVYTPVPVPSRVDHAYMRSWIDAGRSEAHDGDRRRAADADQGAVHRDAHLVTDRPAGRPAAAARPRRHSVPAIASRQRTVSGQVQRWTILSAGRRGARQS
jgi:hypothetical protein